MKYFVVSDIHSFYDEFINTLAEKGFNECDDNHKLIVCGDLMDRGSQSMQLQDYIMRLMNRDKVILIKGNHEDLTEELIHKYYSYCLKLLNTHHYYNGTVDTVCQLTQMSHYDIMFNPITFLNKISQTPYIKKIIPSMVNYFETEHYIFVHGWFPYWIEDWRNASKEDWEEARWVNGMDKAYDGYTINGKTIVCGHWHCSYGNAKYGNNSTNESDYSPYYNDGIIAIDGCTVLSGIVNCIVIED